MALDPIVLTQPVTRPPSWSSLRTLVLCALWLTLFSSPCWAADLGDLEPLAREVPGHSRVHHLLGQAHFDRGDFARAASEFEIVIGREPNFSQARASLAQSYVLMGKAGRAEEILKAKLGV